MRFVKVVLHFVVADSFLRFAQKIHVTLHQVVFIATHICICVYHFLHLHPHRYFVLSLTEPVFLFQGVASICAHFPRLSWFLWRWPTSGQAKLRFLQEGNAVLLRLIWAGAMNRTPIATAERADYVETGEAIFSRHKHKSRQFILSFSFADSPQCLTSGGLKTRGRDQAACGHSVIKRPTTVDRFVKNEVQKHPPAHTHLP